IFGEVPFRPLGRPEPWESHGPRRAAISAFGFGGNNAHLLVEEWTALGPDLPIHAPQRAEVAIVGVGAQVADTAGTAGRIDALRAGQPRGAAREVRLPLKGLRFPPSDLEQTLGQQTSLLASALEAVRGLQLPRERTGVFVGAQCDVEVARYGARWRSAEWSAAHGLGDDWTEAARDGLIPALRS